MFAPRLVAGAEVHDRRDGTWVVLDTRRGRHVVIGERQAAVARRLDGRALADVARATLDERGTIPFGEILGLCRALASAQLLEGADRDASVSGRPRILEKARDVASITLFQKVVRSKRLEAIAAADPKIAGKRVLGIQAIAGVAGAMLFALAGPPALERVLLPGGNPALGLVLAYLGLSSALALRGAFRAFAARLSSQAPMAWRLALVSGVLTVDPGSRALAASPRLARVGGAALGVTGLIALSAFYRLAGRVLGEAHAPQLDIAALATLLVAFVDLCPIGHTAAHDVFTALMPRGTASGDGLSYLRRRAVRRLWAKDFFDGERVLVAWICWSIAWFMTASRLISTLIEGNLPPLLATLGAGDAPPLTVAVALLLAGGLGALAVATTAGIFGALVAGVVSLFPSGGGASRRRESRDFDQVHAARLLADVPVFRRLGPGKLQQIASRARRQEFRKGALLVTQGDPGDTFYVLWSGRAEVLREQPSGARDRLAVLSPPDCFGEVALVESVPRTASVRALGPVVALAIGRDDFAAAASGSDAESVRAMVRGANVMRASPLFRELEPDVLAALLRKMDLQAVTPGQVVMRKGDPGDRFYFIVEGSVTVSADEGKTLATLGPGEPIGEIALLADSPRTATVTAKTDGSLLTLERDAFFEFFRLHLALGEKLERVAGERLPAASDPTARANGGGSA